MPREEIPRPAPPQNRPELSAGLLRREPMSGATERRLPPDSRRLPPPNLPGQRLPEPSRDYIHPTHADAFRCIGSDCEDTCCSGWGVPVDQGTYERYRSDAAMKQHLGTLVVLNTSSPSSADYARIPLTTQSTCPFLDAELLCGIQKALGAAMLPNTCATYPRALSSQAGEHEAALNLSCPEAARLTLLNPNLLVRPPWRNSSAQRYQAFQHDANQLPADYQPRLALRELFLLLLSDRDYPLWQRLYLGGILARRLDAVSERETVAGWIAAKPAQLAQLLADSARVATLNRLRSTMDEIRAQPELQLQLVMELLRLRLTEPPVPARFIECVQDFESGLGVATATNEQQILDSYANGYRIFYQPLLARHPQLIENYLMNYVFKNGYPFSKTESPGTEVEHLSLCIHAALIQTLLIGMAAHHQEAFDTGHVVKLVQSLARTFEHSKRSIEQIAGFVRARELNNPRGITLLLRQPE
jgi:lysine-N-methylase